MSVDVTYDLGGYVFVWDSEKAEINRQKHGISFEQACEVSFDDFYKMYEDPRAGEQRWIIVGHSYLAHPIHPLYVVAAERADDGWRIISARLATASERRRYEEENGPD